MIQLLPPTSFHLGATPLDVCGAVGRYCRHTQQPTAAGIRASCKPCSATAEQAAATATEQADQADHTAVPSVPCNAAAPASCCCSAVIPTGASDLHADGQRRPAAKD